MRGTKFKRLAAFVLCTAMLLGEAAVVAFAADPDGASGSTTQTAIADLKEILNAISYNEYQAENEEVAPGTEEISIDLSEYAVDEGDEGFVMTKIDGVDVLYTPKTGSVSWVVNVPKRAKYAIMIEYYPSYTEVEGEDGVLYEGTSRATSIERILKINDSVPFAEARFVTLPKNWVNEYAKAIYVGEDLDDLVTDAETVGMVAEKRDATDAERSKYDVSELVEVTIPDYMTADRAELIEAYELRFFVTDINNNELRPTAVDAPRWMTYYLKDSSGYYTDNFEIVFEAGENKITLEGQNEELAIKSITLYPYESAISYADYIDKYKDMAPGTETIKLEAEEFVASSNKTIYPIEDRSCAINSPSDVTRSVLNTVGGDKWATASQYVEYKFVLSEDAGGMYDIVSRFRQNVLDGMYTCRSMYLYSGVIVEGEGKGKYLAGTEDGYYNGAPFAEALKLAYDFDESWQVTELAGVRYDVNGDGEIDGDDAIPTYEVYLKGGVEYTVRFEVTLGNMGDIVREVQDVLTQINNDYLNIIKLTGITPDSYRDYGFMQVMPDTMIDMAIQADRLEAVAETLTQLAGESSNVGTLKKVARLLDEMATDEDEVAKNLSNLKTYIGTLGTFLSDAQTQPLQLDYIVIQPATDDKDDLPRAKPNFFESFVHEISGFFQSFFRDYDSMGSLVENEEGAIEVWMESGRDQFQVLRSLINNDFTANQNIPVDLKLVAAGTLLPSILAGSGPDISLGRAQVDVINYAIRSAIVNIEDMEGFSDFALEYEVDENFNIIYDENGNPIVNENSNFNHAAMLVLGIEDADERMHYYGLPEVQAFPMMFLRTDILADLDLEIPKTWDDVMACIPTLQANNMQIGLTTEYKIFMYQQGGDLFADDGMRINLDDQISLAAFEKMCNLFTMYSFPYEYNAANRFRTGEMPIIIGDYTGMYNQLKVFATEIEGKWKILPLPGEIQSDGSVNNVSISAVTATVMVKGCEGEQKENAWKFMQWYTGKDCQVDFSNEMVAILGPSAKQATANKFALSSLPWTTDELTEVEYQFSNLAAVPNYPGAYIIDRYTNFAFLNAYTETIKADPSDALLAYINTINKEITRKREEFNLETLSDGNVDYKNLLTKRLAQLEDLVEFIRENDEYSESAYGALVDQLENAIQSDDVAEINAVREKFLDVINELDPDGSKYKADKEEVMGYDMTLSLEELSKDERKKLRKCFSYEVYKNTSSIITQFNCVADFLQDAARLTSE